MSQNIPQDQHRKTKRKKKRSLLPWLLLFVLLAANVATFFGLWFLLSNQGQASGSLGARFLLPEATLAAEPTPIATQVEVYLPTATVTPTPTQTPTPAPTSVPISQPAVVATPTSPPIEEGIKHVVIISIDGLRPDALDLAFTPTLDKLRAAGSYSPEAQTVSISLTLPSHASMLSGMTPDKHGIHWNAPYIGWTGMNGPTLFNVAHDAGLSTAMVFGKEKLNYLVLPNSVDKLFGENTHDPEVKTEAVKFITEDMPDVLFIHFPDTDIVGHAYGWMSEQQLQSVRFVDGMIGEIVAALETGGYLNNTLLIITADHGGRDFTHGDDSPEDRTIPWLATGPGVLQGVILSQHIDTYDTAATVLYALNLPIPEHWDGKPVLEIFK